jgi:two-component system chemotaxis response regulator CheY
MPAANHLSVLIVDDQMSMRGITRNALHQLGVTKITEARNGNEALTMLDGVTLVISDWNMPDMDGLTLLRTVRSRPATKTMPFIMCTGNASSDFVQSAIKAGVNNYIVKPFDFNTFKKRIEQVTGALTR